GGLEGKINCWGDEPVSPKLANIWQGRFPDRNTLEDGYARTAPVGSYPPNGYGLHDMAGNVWEWCSDRYRGDEYARRIREAGESGVVVNPRGPRTPPAPTDQYIHR